MHKWIVILLVFIIVAAVWQMKAHTLQSGDFPSVGVEEFAQLIANADSVMLVDVRTPQEYAESHLPGAILIDVKDSTFLSKSRSLLSKEKTIAVYCRSGRRSVTAATQLTKEGYKVVNLLGGIMAWTKEQMPVEE